MQRAKDEGDEYILVIEGTPMMVRAGHRYYKGGSWHTCKKNGASQFLQLMTITRKYKVPVHYFSDRQNMAIWIQEYLMTYTRGVL